MTYEVINPIPPFALGQIITVDDKILGDNPDHTVKSSKKSIDAHIKFLLENNIVKKKENLE
jgi:hypothetical protein